MTLTTIKRGRTIQWLSAMWTMRHFGTKVFHRMVTREGLEYSPVRFK